MQALGSEYIRYLNLWRRTLDPKNSISACPNENLTPSNSDICMDRREAPTLQI